MKSGKNSGSTGRRSYQLPDDVSVLKPRSQLTHILHASFLIQALEKRYDALGWQLETVTSLRRNSDRYNRVIKGARAVGKTGPHHP